MKKQLLATAAALGGVAGLVSAENAHAALGFTAGPSFGYFGGAGLTAADFNNDGWPDFMAGGMYNSVSNQKAVKYLNNGAGGATASETELDGILTGTSTSSFMYMTSADVNNDGNIDLIVSYYQAISYISATKVFTNNGSTLGSTLYDASTINGTNGVVAVADIDNDGDLDLAIDRHLFTNNNQGVFKYAYTLTGAGVSFGHLNSDGFIDLITTAGIYTNKNGAGFANIGSLAGSTKTILADLDNDGDFDAVAGTNVYQNNGGNYSKVSHLNLPNVSIYALAAADMDNDGYMDINAIGYQTFNVFTNNRAMNFINANIGASGNNSSSFINMDFDNDGRVDYLVAGFNETRLYRSTGSLPANSAPLAPSVLTPNNSVLAANPNGLVIEWNAGSDDITPVNALTYEYTIGSNSGKGNIAPGIYELSSHGTTPGGYRKARVIIKNEGQYYFRVRAVDATMKRSPYSAEIAFTVLKPATNLNLSAAEKSVTLTWTHNSSYTEKSRVYRSFQGGFYQMMSETETITMSYSEIVPNYGTYSYKIGSYDENTGKEIYSEPASISIGLPAPSISSNYTTLDPSQNQLWWTEVTGALGYSVERSPDGDSWSQVAGTAFGTTNYVDSVSVGFWYYRVGTVASTYTNYSSILIINMDNRSIINEVARLQLTGASNQMFVQWEDRSVKEERFWIKRGQSPADMVRSSYTPPDFTQYLDTSLETHRWYFYQVEAVKYKDEYTDPESGDVITNWEVLAASPVASNFTGNLKMNVSSLFMSDKGNGHYMGLFTVQDPDNDRIEKATMDYSTNGIDWTNATIEGGESFVPSSSYSILWNSRKDLFYNGKVRVRLNVFDGFEWNTGGEHEVYLLNGATTNFSLSSVPEISSDAAGLLMSGLVSGGTVRVFTLKGQLVREYTVQEDGLVNWDLNNQSGARVKIGYYIILFTANGQTMKKVVFIAR